MKHVLLNLKFFIIREKFIFFVIILCVVSSAFIINFAYGLYYNYDTQKTEAEFELKDLALEIAEGATVTKGEYQAFLESLDTETQNAMTNIYCSGLMEDYPNGEEVGWKYGDSDCKYGHIFMRFVIHDGEYGISEIERSNFEENGQLMSGRYLTNNDQASGAKVAIIYYDESYNNGAGGIPDDTKALQKSEDSITLFGEDFEVIGVHNDGGDIVPMIPFLSVADDAKVTDVGFTFERNITRPMYNEMKSKADEYLPGKLIFPELQFPDTDTISIYNNMIVISLVISALSLINFAMLYRYMIDKRQRHLAIMRICGCRKSCSVMIYLGECFLLTVPSYLIGTAINIVLTKNVLNKLFDFIDEAYSLKVYLTLGATYFAAFIVVLSIMIFTSVNKSILREWRE